MTENPDKPPVKIGDQSVLKVEKVETTNKTTVAPTLMNTLYGTPIVTNMILRGFINGVPVDMDKLMQEGAEELMKSFRGESPVDIKTVATPEPPVPDRGMKLEFEEREGGVPIRPAFRCMAPNRICKREFRCKSVGSTPDGNFYLCPYLEIRMSSVKGKIKRSGWKERGEYLELDG